MINEVGKELGKHWTLVSAIEVYTVCLVVATIY
jgi:hypothetical protein